MQIGLARRTIGAAALLTTVSFLSLLRLFGDTASDSATLRGGSCSVSSTGRDAAIDAASL